MKKDKIISVYIDQNAYEKFKICCQEKNASMSKTLRIMIMKILEEAGIELVEREQLNLF